MIFKRKYFKLFFIIYMFINTLALGYFGINVNYMFIPVMIWALLIIGHDIYKRKLKQNNSYNILMVIQGLVLLLATILNDYSDLNSYIIALMQLVIYILIFGNPATMKKQEIVAEVKLIIPVVNVLVGFASVISLGMYLIDYGSIANGWNLGMVGNRLCGIYFNSNPAAFLACITIILALIAIRQKYKFKAFYLVNIVIQIIYILLTKCRAALIILVIIGIVIVYYFIIRRRSYSNVKRIGLILLLSITLTLTGFVGHYFENYFPIVKKVNIKETSRFQIDEIKTASQLLISGNSDDFNKGLAIIDEVSNGRISLIKVALEIWQTQPLIGVGANNFKKIGIQETDILEYWAIQVVHSHNVFLEALVATGIIGFILFVAFFIQSIVMCFGLLKKCKKTSKYFIVQMFSVIVLSEFVGSLFDYGVFYIYSLSATLAWCFLGYLFTYQNILDNCRKDEI